MTFFTAILQAISLSSKVQCWRTLTGSFLKATISNHNVKDMGMSLSSIREIQAVNKNIDLSGGIPVVLKDFSSMH